jgi:hypothetical protein
MLAFMNQETKPEAVETAPSAMKPLSEVALRALAEAAARKSPPPPSAKEFNGRKGPDPVRYGDWEVKGLASDF